MIQYKTTCNCTKKKKFNSTNYRQPPKRHVAKPASPNGFHSIYLDAS